MKILFIYRTASLDVTDPLGIMSISAVLKRAGHTVDLLIPNLESNLFKKVRSFAPDIIGFSVTTGSEDYYLEMIRRLKEELSFTAVFGGPHPTFFPDVLQCEGLDAICRGEADEAIVEFADRMEKGLDITGVMNFHVKVDGRIHQNPLRPLIRDLDTLPFVDRDILNKYAGYRHSRLRFFFCRHEAVRMTAPIVSTIHSKKCTRNTDAENISGREALIICWKKYARSRSGILLKKCIFMMIFS